MRRERFHNNCDERLMKFTNIALLIVTYCSLIIGFTLEKSGSQEVTSFTHPHCMSSEIDYLAPFPARLGQKDMNYIIVIDKRSRVLYLLHSNKEFWAIVRTFPVAIGSNDGQKQKRDDLRTPEGIYFIINRKEDRELPAKYGPLSYVLNYPNRTDLSANRSGGGIWIHGTNRGEVPVDTRGCLELHNNNLVKLAAIINRGTMIPVIITNSPSCNLREVVNLEKIWQERQFLIAGEEGEKTKLGPQMVEKWSNLHLVEGCEKSDTLFQKDTLYMVDTVVAIDTIRKQKLVTKTDTIIQIDTIQKQKKLVQVDTIFEVDTILKRKELVQTDTIVLRDTIHKKLIDTIIETKTVTISQIVFDTLAHRKAIHQLVDKWEEDWESRDVERYGSNYDTKAFRSGEIIWSKWIHEKRRNFAEYSSITINVMQPEIFNLTDSSAIVEFNQVYKSDFFTVKNGKRLSLFLGDSGWKIRREETISQKKL